MQYLYTKLLGRKLVIRIGTSYVGLPQFATVAFLTLRSPYTHSQNDYNEIPDTDMEGSVETLEVSNDGRGRRAQKSKSPLRKYIELTIFGFSI